MEAKNMDLMNVTDEDIESLKRVFKIARCGRHYQEDTKLVDSWLIQWNERLEYDTYKADKVELLEKEKMLFLIPKEDKLPIKLIIA